MRSFLVGMILLGSAAAFGQVKANAYVPSPIPIQLADLALAQPMIVAKEGVYVCGKEYTMFVNMPEPKVKAKDYKQRADPRVLVPVLDPHARLSIRPGNEEYIPVCFKAQ